MLFGKLSDVLNDEQKKNKVDYLLKKLKERGKIVSNEKRLWVLAE